MKSMASQRWILLLAGIAAVVLAWQLAMPSSPAGDRAGNIDSADIGRRAAVVNNAVAAVMTEVRDAATAEASLVKLRAHSATVLDLREMAEKLPAGGRRELAGIIGPWLPPLEARVAVTSNAAGGEIVKPVLEQIVERMKALTKG